VAPPPAVLCNIRQFTPVSGGTRLIAFEFPSRLFLLSGFPCRISERFIQRAIFLELTPPRSLCFLLYVPFFLQTRLSQGSRWNPPLSGCTPRPPRLPENRSSPLSGGSFSFRFRGFNQFDPLRLSYFRTSTQIPWRMLLSPPSVFKAKRSLYGRLEYLDSSGPKKLEVPSIMSHRVFSPHLFAFLRHSTPPLSLPPRYRSYRTYEYWVSGLRFSLCRPLFFFDRSFWMVDLAQFLSHSLVFVLLWFFFFRSPPGQVCSTARLGPVLDCMSGWISPGVLLVLHPRFSYAITSFLLSVPPNIFFPLLFELTHMRPPRRICWPGMAPHSWISLRFLEPPLPSGRVPDTELVRRALPPPGGQFRVSSCPYRFLDFPPIFSI